MVLNSTEKIHFGPSKYDDMNNPWGSTAVLKSVCFKNDCPYRRFLEDKSLSDTSISKQRRDLNSGLDYSNSWAVFPPGTSTAILQSTKQIL